MNPLRSFIIFCSVSSVASCEIPFPYIRISRSSYLFASIFLPIRISFVIRLSSFLIFSLFCVLCVLSRLKIKVMDYSQPSKIRVNSCPFVVSCPPLFIPLKSVFICVHLWLRAFGLGSTAPCPSVVNFSIFLPNHLSAYSDFFRHSSFFPSFASFVFFRG